MEENTKSLKIDNSVIYALKNAIFDILDHDGVKSIFGFANLSEMTNNIDKSGVSKYSTLIKIMDALSVLLQYSPKIMLEIGKKFSFYFDPFGSNLDDFIESLNKFLILITFHYELINSNEILIGIEENTVDPSRKSLLSDKWLLLFYKGMFSEAIQKSIGGSVKITLEKRENHCCHFKIKTDNEIKI